VGEVGRMRQFGSWGEFAREFVILPIQQSYRSFPYLNMVICLPKIMQQMSAKHPFLDEAYLWLSPRDYFFVGEPPNSKLTLQWDRLPRIRRIAPTTRIIDPDSNVSLKKVPIKPVNLPSMRTIVSTLYPGVLQLWPKPPTPVPVAVRGGGDGNGAVASSSSVRVEDVRRQPPMEKINIGDEEEFDWEWWGSSKSNSTRYTILWY